MNKMQPLNNESLNKLISTLDYVLLPRTSRSVDLEDPFSSVRYAYPCQQHPDFSPVSTSDSCYFCQHSYEINRPKTTLYRPKAVERLKERLSVKSKSNIKQVKLNTLSTFRHTADVSLGSLVSPSTGADLEADEDFEVEDDYQYLLDDRQSNDEQKYDETADLNFVNPENRLEIKYQCGYCVHYSSKPTKFVFILGERGHGASSSIVKAYIRKDARKRSNSMTVSLFSNKGSNEGSARPKTIPVRLRSKWSLLDKGNPRLKGMRCLGEFGGVLNYARDLDMMTPVAVKRMQYKKVDDDPSYFYPLLQREKYALYNLCYNGYIGNEQELKTPPRFSFKKAPESNGFRKGSPFLIEFFGSYYHPPRDEHYLVFEYCDGGNLSIFTKLSTEEQDYLMTTKGNMIANDNRGLETINFQAIAAVTVGILRGLEAIHNAGFIHADIKPDNILLRYPGIVKICDFGLCAKVFDENHEPIPDADFHALGTVGYMSPELMKKNVYFDIGSGYAEMAAAALYDEKTDIWSVGVLLLELIIGRLPLGILKEKKENEYCGYIMSLAEPDLYNHPDQQSGLGFLFNYRKTTLTKKEAEQDKLALYQRIPITRKFKKPKVAINYLLGKASKIGELEQLKKVKGMFLIGKCFDFIARCLMNDYKIRPSAKDLHQHDFIRLASLEMDALLPNMSALQTQWQHHAGQRTFWKDHKCSLTIRPVYNIMRDYEKVKLYRSQLSQQTRGNAVAHPPVGDDSTETESLEVVVEGNA